MSLLHDKFLADVAAVFIGDKTNGSFGSGRLIAPGLILTAGHIVDYPTRETPTRTGWKVRLLKDRIRESAWQDALPREADVVWRGSGNLDLALLRLNEANPSKPILKPVFAMYSFLDRIDDVVATGFPEAIWTTSRAVSDYTVHGILHIANQFGPFDWSVSPADHPATPDDWKGMSGAAVCSIGLEDTLYLLGIVEKVPAKFSHAKLHVARLSQGFDDNIFCNHLQEALGELPEILRLDKTQPDLAISRHYPELIDGTSQKNFTSDIVPLLDNTDGRLYCPQQKKSAANDFAEELIEVRRLSYLAVHDAAVIEREQRGKYTEEIRLDENLYVKRSIEDIINSYIEKTKNDFDELPRIVIGDAGFGKTSLLWNIYKTYINLPEYDPWFIKSSVLIKSTTQDKVRKGKLSQTHLLHAIYASRNEGRHPILLIDTIDLLLHSPEDKEYIAYLLLTLKDTSCAVLATSRPQEANELSSALFKKISLSVYNEQELEEAVHNHAQRFYNFQKEEDIDIKNHVEKIKNAVARGTPIREVCLNPLTLRMLFVLYTPDRVPLEINVFKLYKEYWKLRVEKDCRAGEEIRCTESEDLQITAMATALAMLAEGFPEIDTELLDESLHALAEDKHKIEILITRGILRNVGGDNIAFFHQTFFEHSAARGLLYYLGINAFHIIQERIAARPTDLFITPILEQVLLLAEKRPAPISNKANASLSELLSAESIILKTSGIYVYTHRNFVPDSIESYVKAALPCDDQMAILRFLYSAPNMPSCRVDSLFVNLGIIWERSIWREQSHVLEVLERLEYRYPDKALHFMIEHKLFSVTSIIPALGYKCIFKITSHIFRDCANLDINYVTDILLKSFGQNISRDYAITMINLFHAIFECRPTRGFASNVLSIAKTLKNVDCTEVSRALGHLHWLEWNCFIVDLKSILNLIRQTDNGLALMSMLEGLTQFLLHSDDHFISMAWAVFENEQNLSRKWRWAQIVWPRLLHGGFEEPFLIYNKKIVFKDSIRHFIIKKLRPIVCTCSSAICAKVTDKKHPAIIRGSQCQDILNSASLTSAEIIESLQCDSLYKLRPWMCPSCFSKILIKAYLAGHEGAIKTLTAVRHYPKKFPDEFKSRIGSLLASTQVNNQEIAEMIFRYLCDIEDGTSLHRFLINNEDSITLQLSAWSPALIFLVQKLVLSQHGTARRSGLLLWIFLLKRKLCSPPTPKNVINLYKKENDMYAKASILLIVGYCSLAGSLTMDEAIEFLKPMVNHNNENTRNKAIESLLMIITNTPEDPIFHLDFVINTLTAGEINTQWLKGLGWLVERYAKGDMPSALKILHKVVTLPALKKMGRDVRHTLSIYYRRPVQTIVRDTNSNAWKEILNFVPEANEVLAKMLVEVVCQERSTEAALYLENIFTQKGVTAEVKDVIRRFKYRNERANGSDGWHELYTLIKPQRQTTA